jgi:alpha-beta hydrolase superfamily lysophospholipase
MSDMASERSFVVTRDTITLASERIVRTAERVDSSLLDQSQGLRIYTTMTLGADALVAGAVVTVHAATAPLDAAPLQRVTLTFDAEGVLFSMGAGESSTSTRVAAPAGTLPFLNLSIASAEQIVMRAKAIGGESAEVPIAALIGGTVASAMVRWSDAESVVLSLGAVEMHARVAASGEITSAVVPQQRVRFARAGGGPEEITDAASTPHASRPDYSAPADAPYTAEEVRVPNASAGIELAGTLTMPHHTAGARVPAAVMITGSGPQDRDEATPVIPGYRPFREIADALGRRGIAVLRLDDRGVGGSPSGPPGATSADFANDIRAALDFLRRRDDIDATHLALVGHSEGGVIAPMVAAMDAALGAIVIIAGPSRSGRVVSDEQVRAALMARGLSGDELEAQIETNARVRDAQVAASPWLRFWFDYDPIATAKRVRQPVLIVQGATDTQVTPDHAEELAAAFRAGGNRDVTLRLLPDINHLLVHDPNGAFTEYGKLANLSVSPVVLDAIGDWLQARLH